MLRERDGRQSHNNLAAIHYSKKCFFIFSTSFFNFLAFVCSFHLQIWIKWNLSCATVNRFLLYSTTKSPTRTSFKVKTSEPEYDQLRVRVFFLNFVITQFYMHHILPTEVLIQNKCASSVSTRVSLFLAHIQKATVLIFVLVLYSLILEIHPLAQLYF